MFRSYLKVAFRNIRKYRMFSFINIAGLALGMACFLLIVHFIRFERGTDRFHRNEARIFTVVRDNRTADYSESRTNTGAPLAPLLLQNIPQVREAVRLTCFRSELVSYGEKQFAERKFFYADDSLLRVFDFPLAAGDAATALRDPFSVLLTEAAAARYFGGDDPVGKTLLVRFGGRRLDFRVTGVLRNIPLQSHLDFDFLASYRSLPGLVGEEFMTSHWDSPTWTYILLSPGSSPAEVEALLATVTRKFVDKRSWTEIGHHLLRLRDVYFRSPGPAPGRHGNSQFLIVLSAIAFFILLIACVNFMNLSTARSGTRAKEIGLRKAVGAQKDQLLGQFLGESLVHSFLALVLALGLVQLLLPAFNAFVGKPLRVNYLGDLPFLLIMILTAAAVGALAGGYPAFVLSALRPIQVIRGRVGKGGSSAALVRKGLVVVQFAISIALLIAVGIVFRQVVFLRGMDVGFEKENVVTVPIRDRAVRARYELLKARFLQSPGVVSVAATSMEPGVDSQNGISIRAGNAQELDMGIIYVDHDYAGTLGISVVAGRDFARENATDAASGVLLNRTLADKLGWRAEGAVGRPVEMFFKEGGRSIPVYQTTVVGVVEDFNFRDLTTEMQPILLKIDPRRFEYILVRIAGEGSPAAIDGLRRAWNEFLFEQPFEFRFLEDDMNAVYRNFEAFGSVIRSSALVAVFIACLGLFGLAAFTIERRTKEIGIRKVLGATVTGLVGLVTREFMVPVAAANLAAWPAAYLLMSRWLQNFAYRTAVSGGTFALSGGLALAVAFLTVAGQSIRAAVANPVESLRYE